jgi:hypothetical protein
MLDCRGVKELNSGDPNLVLDWLAEEVKTMSEACEKQYYDLRRAVRARQED